MEKALKFLPIFLGGGIGDIIISLAWMNHVIKPLNIPVKFYCQFPQIGEYFLPWVEICGNIRQSEYDKHLFDYYINLSDMVNFQVKNINKMPESLKNLYLDWGKISKEWENFILKNPLEGNQMAHKAIKLGLNRRTLAFYMVNKIYKPYYLDNVEDINIPNKFITIHDGFDASNHYKFERSTKSWDINSLNILVKLFKKNYPDIHVIQIGGVKHRKINNVDINLAGQISFETSLRYLKSSILHIDIESGLIHARRLFNKQSIVLFGPTNVDYFSYKENINIAPKFCGDCWWIERDWMARCKEGYSTPKCMDSISVLTVFKEILKIIPHQKTFINTEII